MKTVLGAWALYLRFGRSNKVDIKQLSSSSIQKQICNIVVTLCPVEEGYIFKHELYIAAFVVLRC